MKRCLLQGGVCEEKVSQQGEHGPREDGEEEQCEDNEGQEEETQGENTEESQGEETGEKRHCRKGRREMGQDPVTVLGGDRGTRTVPRCGRREQGGMLKRRQQECWEHGEKGTAVPGVEW